MEVEISMESVVSIEAGGSRLDFKSCGKTPKSFYQAFFVDRHKILECLINKLGSFGIRSEFFESTVFPSSVVREHFQFGTALVRSR